MIRNYIFYILLLSSQAWGALTFTTPLDRQIYQRNYFGQGTIIVLASTAGGTAVTAKVRANPVSTYPGTDTGFVSVALIGGAVQGSIKASSGWYTLEIQTYDAGLAVVDDITLGHVGIGDNFIIYGQSNAANYFSPLITTAPDDRVNCRGVTNADPWRLCIDPMPTADNSLSSGWPIVGNQLVGSNGFPVGFINVSMGNTSSNDWLPGFVNYARLKTALPFFPNCGFRAVLYDQGENDAATSVTMATYIQNVTTTLTQLRNDAGCDVPMLIAIATHPNETTGANVIAAQTGLLGNYFKVYAGANTDSLNNTFRYDTVHFNTSTGRNAFANLWFNAINALPTIRPGAPIVIDSSSSKFCFFNGSAWKCTQGL